MRLLLGDMVWPAALCTKAFFPANLFQYPGFCGGGGRLQRSVPLSLALSSSQYCWWAWICHFVLVALTLLGQRKQRAVGLFAVQGSGAAVFQMSAVLPLQVVL